MAHVFNTSPISAEDIEYRFCDAESIKLQSDKHLTFINTYLSSKITPWKKFFEETTHTNDTQLDGLFDLPEQQIIDEDCRGLIDEGEIPEEKKELTLLTLRKVITIYSKSEQKIYQSGNGWIPLLSRIITMYDSVLDIYTFFKKVKDTYVPTPQTHGFILKLLLRYHDPSFYTWINVHEIHLDQCTASWFNSLFAENCTKPVCDLLWESFITCQDSFRIFFIALSIILLQKSNLEKMETSATSKIYDTIKIFPNFINTQDLIDILENTKKLDNNTPPLFREAFGYFMFGDKRDPVPKWLPLLLPVSVASMLENLQDARPPNIVSDYFIVDCRPSNQHAGGFFSFKHKYHIDCNTLIKSSAETQTINDIQLLIARIESVENISKNTEIHICLIGSNVITNDKCVYTIAHELLKRNKRYVSMLYGGYEMIHNTLKKTGDFDVYAIDHNGKKCIVCNPMRKKFTNQIKRNLLKSKKRILSCVNSMDDNCENSNDIEYVFNIKEKDNIFREKNTVSRTHSTTSAESDIHGVGNPSISNKSEQSTDHDSLQSRVQFKIVMINEYLGLPEAKKFKCTEISSDESKFNSVLIITNTNLIHLRLIKDFKENAYLMVNCHMFFITSIEMNAKNVVTIKFDRTHVSKELLEKYLVPFDEIRYKIRERERFNQVFHEKYRILQGQ